MSGDPDAAPQVTFGFVHKLCLVLGAVLVVVGIVQFALDEDGLLSILIGLVNVVIGLLNHPAVAASRWVIFLKLASLALAVLLVLNLLHVL